MVLAAALAMEYWKGKGTWPNPGSGGITLTHPVAVRENQFHLSEELLRVSSWARARAGSVDFLNTKLIAKVFPSEPPKGSIVSGQN